MSDEWRRVPAASVARIEIGGTPAREQPTFWADQDSGHAWASIADLNCEVVVETAEYISDLGVKSSNVKLVPTGTPIMSFKLTIGRTSLAGRDLYTNEAIAAFFADRARVDPRFLFHALPGAARSVITDVAIKGATLNKKSLSSMKLSLPPIREQRRIREILDALDDQVRTAESITAKLVTLEDGMLTDLLNAVPQDHNRRLEHLLLVPPRNGYSPVAASWPTGEYMLGLGCLTTRGFVPRQLKNAPIDDLRLRPFLLNDGDILISRSNTRDLVGLAGVFREVSSPCYYPDLMMRLIPSNSVSSEYLALVLNSHRVRRQIMNAASGTSGSMVKITKSTVGSLYLPIPSRPEQDRIASTVERLSRTLDCELDQLQKLRRLKSGLTADLLTGRVRVPLEVAS